MREHIFALGESANSSYIRPMTPSKLCPHPGCTTKINRSAKFCLRHTDRKGNRWPIVAQNKICDLCGSPFQTTNGRQRFCLECREGTCVICGQSFKRDFRARKVVTTCSRPCSAKLAGQSRTRQTLTCLCCGIQFQPLNGHTKKKYCSLKCKHLASRRPQADKRRNTYKYRLWREAVYARDRYTCQQCGAKGEIQAHHIKSWEKHPKLRFEVANGVTLCQTCHENIHGAHIPRVAKRTTAICANCGKATKGRRLLMPHLPQAKLAIFE